MKVYLAGNQGPLPFKSLRGTVVKQFTAGLIFLSMLWAPLQSYADGPLCKHVFLEVTQIDTLRFEKFVEAYVKDYGTQAPSYITVTHQDGRQERIKTPDSLKHKFNPQKNLNIALTGVLGRIYDLSKDPLTSKISKSISQPFADEVLAKTRKNLQQFPKAPISNTLKKILNQQFIIENLTPETVLIKLPQKQNSIPNFDDLTKAIRNRFQTNYLFLVNWVYRVSGLEENSVLANAKMSDEIAAYAKEYKAFEFHLLFDQKVWQVELQLLNGRINEYQNTKDLERKKQLLEEISQPNDPFLPFAGLVTAVNMLDPQEPVELKRYFSNDSEDPLKLLNLKDKNDFFLRQKLIYRSIELLPPHQKLEIHAHTNYHVRMYTRLGFVEAQLIENPKYPGLPVHLLKADREKVLEKMSAILKKIE